MKAPADFANFADDSEKTIGCLYKHFFIDLIENFNLNAKKKVFTSLNRSKDTPSQTDDEARFLEDEICLHFAP
ncbi:hypothetical protein [Chryseobacterium gambrini]|uniref:Uncharacterized protein n=1 Tax=Chryseobacterium gambrini TaxID=373672 RepID=A0ABM8K9I7_9FLAO|nr:hypothetical protein CRDW_30540 [Chryseobacterium gambrini]